MIGGSEMAKKKTKNINKKKFGKIAHARRSIVQGLEQINLVINRLENEVEGLVKKIVKQGERSRRELRRNFDDLLSKIRGGEFFAIATETRDDVEREVRRLAEDIVGLVKEIELIPARLDVQGVYREARRNLLTLVDQLSDNGFVQRAKATLFQTRKEVLSLLSIPTQDEVEKLERKIVSLEKRLSNLSRKAA
jgi:polyhydroxyalkanoate synthesis regulator phasin